MKKLDVIFPEEPNETSISVNELNLREHLIILIFRHRSYVLVKVRESEYGWLCPETSTYMLFHKGGTVRDSVQEAVNSLMNDTERYHLTVYKLREE